MSRSSYGRGYATCLFQFTMHDNLEALLAYYAEMWDANAPDLFGAGMAVEMWALGAADHLRDLCRPSPWKGTRFLAAREIATRAHYMGRSWRTKWTADDARTLLAEARDIVSRLGVTTLDEAVAWDRNHRLAPDPGETRCVEPMSKRLGQEAEALPF